jgi:uncharacterized hydantoinase/oxoprolinase family protein
MLRRFWNWLLGKTTIDEKIEERVDNVKKTIVATKQKANNAIEELKDVFEAVEYAVEDVMEEVDDVIEAVKSPIVIEGKVTKSKLREIKKADLLQHAQDMFDVKLDSSLSKTNIINKVYELYKETK